MPTKDERARARIESAAELRAWHEQRMARRRPAAPVDSQRALLASRVLGIGLLLLVAAALAAMYLHGPVRTWATVVLGTVGAATLLVWRVLRARAITTMT